MPKTDIYIGDRDLFLPDVRRLQARAANSADSPPHPEAHSEGIFVDMSRPRQVWEAVGGPVVAGSLCGLLLGRNIWAYLVGVVISFVGGIPVASQHNTYRGALWPGLSSAEPCGPPQPSP